MNARQTTPDDVWAMLDELAELTALAEQSPQSFKVRAYETAKRSLQADGRDPASLSAKELEGIKGVGRATASKVAELVATGRVAKLEQLRESFPPAVVQLSRIPGLGPKTLARLRRELGIEDLDSLRAAIDAQQLRELSGLGPASEAKIAKAVDRLGLTSKHQRTPIGEALPFSERLGAEIGRLDGVEDVVTCGSLRRFAESVSDIDITVAGAEPVVVMGRIGAVFEAHPDIAEILLAGDTKLSALTRTGLQIDCRVVEPSQFGAAVLYFTGSKAHNIALRQRALSRGMSLNEYGLSRLDPNDDSPELVSPVGDVSIGHSETAIYAALGMEFVPPPMREATGEIERALADGFDEIVRRDQMRGDLHYHTDRSGDGRSSVEEMVEAAAAGNFEYLAITDHGEDLAINGSTAEEMLEHREHIARVQSDVPDLHLLWGCELNIGPTGGLDYTTEFRALFDYTVASVHSHFDLDRRSQTARLVAAIADPTVDSIGHLTGRYLGRRPGIEIDVDTVLEALFQFDVALEINGSLSRLDASADVVRRAVDRGVKLVINTDSHHTSELGRMEYGVLTAQRGWAPREQVVNTWDRDRFLRWVAEHRRP